MPQRHLVDGQMTVEALSSALAVLPKDFKFALECLLVSHHLVARSASSCSVAAPGSLARIHQGTRRRRLPSRRANGSTSCAHRNSCLPAAPRTTAKLSRAKTDAVADLRRKSRARTSNNPDATTTTDQLKRSVKSTLAGGREWAPARARRRLP